MTDSLTVEGYYVSAAAKIESIAFAGSDTVWTASDMAAVKITGGRRDEALYGARNFSDVFDSDGGGNDRLHGRSGNDVYLLGVGAGHDVIREYSDNSGSGDAGDKIRFKSGIAAGNARLLRSNDGNSLIAQLLNADGAVTDSLTVERHFVSAAARIESVEFAGSDTVWSGDALTPPETGGTADNDRLEGKANSNDTLAGGGDDVYLLGAGAGHDVIREHADNSGDADDKIEIKSGYEPGDIRLQRSQNGEDLIVQLLDDDGKVTDSLTVEKHFTADASAKVESVTFAGSDTVWTADDITAAAVITGGAGDDRFLAGESDADNIFDSAAGGNDRLRGKGGSDVYRLGAGAGDDVILEYQDNSGGGDDGDKIQIKSGYAPADARLRRSRDGRDLIVDLLNDDGTVSDSLTVERHFISAAAKVESVTFEDSDTVWTEKDFTPAAITGGSHHERLIGLNDFSDVFDSSAGGNDTLSGGSGDDVYLLGAGTGLDRICEYYDNTGDDGDKIRIKSGWAPANARLRRSNNGDDLIVELVNDDGTVSDSLTVMRYFTDAAAKAESVEFADRAVWNLAEWAAAETLGTAGKADDLAGLQGVNDTRHGHSGNDTYRFGAGAGHDVIREYAGNDADGDAGDKILLGSGVGAGDVRLLRSRDGNDLIVQLLDDAGSVTDSLTVENHYADAAAKVESVEFADGTVWNAAALALEEIAGAGGETLRGKDNLTDVFDSDGGFNDNLHGGSGSDVYWLGELTGRDTIIERSGDAGDMIRIKSGFRPDDVRLWRSGRGDGDLHVQIVNADGDVTSSLNVSRHYWNDRYKIESVEFADGTVWGPEALALAEITGIENNEVLQGGSDLDDVFDSDGGGDDTLLGYGGDDVYWLGAGTDHDRIREYVNDSLAGDDGDKIKIKSGYARADVRLLHSGNDLLVQLLNDSGEVTDSLRVQNHFSSEVAKIESIETDGHVLLENQFQRLIDEIATFNSGGHSPFNSLDAVYDHYWEEKAVLSSSGG